MNVESSGALRLAAQEVRIEASCGPLLAPVLKRVIGMLVAHENFSVDRIGTAVAISSSLCEAACKSTPDEAIEIKLVTGQGSIAIEIGPLVEGMGETLSAHVVAAEPVAAALLDEIQIEQRSDRELLTLRMTA